MYAIDCRWRRDNLVALLVLCAAGWCFIAWRAQDRLWVAEALPANQARIAAVAEKINPNVASAASLRRLPGIGPVIAANIIEYRGKHGSTAFTKVQDLENVNRLGPATVELIEPYLELPAGRER